MTAKIIDGKKLADKIIKEAGEYASGKGIKLATVITKDDPASDIYVGIKKKTCNSIGIEVEIIKTSDVKTTLQKLNSDKRVTGIIVQLPLADKLDEREVASLIDPSKDVDGLNPINIGRLFYGDETMPACTAYGIVKLLENENVQLEGKKVAIIGRSVHIGKPLSIMLTNRHATVTLCHSKTRNLGDITRDADIVIVAVGKAGFLKEDMIKRGAAVVDVGITRYDGKIAGDADPEIAEKAGLITPVPGGVGPMTVAMLVRNIVNAHKIRNDYAKE